MSQVDVPNIRFTRDQQRALHAYDAVASVPQAKQKDYKIAVNDFGVNVLRSGLCAALASVQRLNGQNDRRGDILLEHLAAANVPGLQGGTAKTLVTIVRQLDVEAYMLATRELLLVAAWLKRAVQATFEEIEDYASGS